jgi:hypothetical protein
LENQRNKILTFSYLLVFLFSSFNLFAQKEKMIDIIQWGTANLSNYEYRDVVIERIFDNSELPFENGYKFNTIRKRNDTLFWSDNFIYQIKDDFDKAAYYWKNDTIIIIRLFNSDTENELKFKWSGDMLKDTGSRQECLAILKDEEID